MGDWESKKKYGKRMYVESPKTSKQQQGKASQNNAKQNNQHDKYCRNTHACTERTQEKLLQHTSKLIT
jgi:hypothetical protein